MIRIILTLCYISMFFIPMTALAGELDAPASPDDSGSAMYSLETIYERLNSGTPGAKRTGSFTEPVNGPTVSTGHSLDEVMGVAPALDNTHGARPEDVSPGKYFWGLRNDQTNTANSGWGLLSGTGGTLDSRVAQTGQTTDCLDPKTHSDWGKPGKDDAYWAEQGVGASWSGDGSRFKDNGDGTVLDQMTGLMWTKNANMGIKDSGENITVNWDDAFTSIDTINTINKGYALPEGCNEDDNVQCYTDWRLPNIKELMSLLDFGKKYPPLPEEHEDVFVEVINNVTTTTVKWDYYWSSTTNVGNSSEAWSVYFTIGSIKPKQKDTTGRVWPVRAGN